ncbi:hypothetical protein BLA29_010258, partial [Euroglyphus maynei]
MCMTSMIVMSFDYDPETDDDNGFEADTDVEYSDSSGTTEEQPRRKVAPTRKRNMINPLARNLSSMLRETIDFSPLSSSFMKSSEQILRLSGDFSRNEIDHCYDDSYGDRKFDLFNMTVKDVVYQYF